jgi:protein O-GlcNAc transferase
MNPQLQLMLQLAIQAFQGGNFDRADLILQEVLQNDINSADSIFELGITYAKANKLIEASAVFNCLLPYKKGDVRILYNLGLIHSFQSNHHLALEAYDLALQIEPNNAEVLVNKGSTCNDIKNYELALEVLEKAIQLRPDIPEAWSNKGVAQSNLNLYHEALKAYEEAIRLNPNYHVAWSNKSTPLNKLKLHTEALFACDKAIALNPDYAEALYNKANTLHELKRFDEAIAHYDKALSLQPDYHEVWVNKGATLHELKRFDEAIAHYDKALSLQPDIDWVWGDLLHTNMKICSWSDLSDSLDIIRKKVMANERFANPLILLSLIDDALLHKKSSEIYTKKRYPLNLTLGHITKRPKNEKIRLAYFSADFRSHPVSFLTAELFELHDKNRFEITAFSFGVDDKSPMRLRLSEAFNKFIDVSDMSDKEIAQLARELEIDIAVDLGGHTKDSRTGIFSHRAAPIQVNWLGYPGTIGANFIDYIVADKTIIPDQSQQFYSEKVISLPDTYMVDDSKRIPSSRVFIKKECGLSENTFIFCCFNNDYKFNPKVLDCWSRILLSAKSSVLWISENNERFRANITIEFDKRGISSNRIIFAQRVALMADYLSRYAMADLFLDTYPYNAHTTALDSLKAGVPVLTLKGKSFASRVAASLLNAIGIPELITSTQEEYEMLAIELALNPMKLSDIKLKLKNNLLTAPLFDTPLFTKNLEAAYIEIYGRYHTSLEPDHITIT